LKDFFLGLKLSSIQLFYDNFYDNQERLTFKTQFFLRFSFILHFNFKLIPVQQEFEGSGNFGKWSLTQNFEEVQFCLGCFCGFFLI
jgi:hypothetical protein